VSSRRFRSSILYYACGMETSAF